MSRIFWATKSSVEYGKHWFELGKDFGVALLSVAEIGRKIEVRSCEVQILGYNYFSTPILRTCVLR
jgi:hypothetical protein